MITIQPFSPANSSKIAGFSDRVALISPPSMTEALHK